MPTSRPRYQVTDTGEVREMLDLAESVWPGEGRKALLMRLAELGREELLEREQREREMQGRERQREALERASALVSPEVLLGDAAWR